MVLLRDYAGREQSYVKHIFLEGYLERLAHKTASRYLKIVYIDGFAGPWQSANERFEDTSFGIALNALRRAKASWKDKRDVSMSTFLVEQDPSAYQKLAQIPIRYPDLTIKIYNDDFLRVMPEILREIPEDAFSFFLIDPKGWKLSLRTLSPLLKRPHSEVIFNFMFDFINRAAGIADPAIVRALDELIPIGNWRLELQNVLALSGATPDDRKKILVRAFGESLKQIGGFEYVAETTVLRPLTDRPLYCLFYATRHHKGMEVFRDSQIEALNEESRTRAATKVRHAASSTGQGEFFESLHDMAPDKLHSFLRDQLIEAKETLLRLTPKHPNFVVCKKLRAQVLARHVVRVPDVNSLAARLRKENQLIFPDWESSRRVPQPGYRTQRA